MNLVFIGFGHMAKALAQGLQGQPHWQLFASSPSKAGKVLLGIEIQADNKPLAALADVLILAVKPALIPKVLTEIKPYLKKDCLVISVAAGVSLQTLEHHSSFGQAIIRAMPNIAAQVGYGATALIANSAVQPKQVKLAEQLFQAFGVITWIEQEKDINAFTALSGSGLAYVFLFLEALIEGAVRLGIEPKLAKTFALQTLNGATHLVKESTLEIKDLRNQVTSPAGTTAAAIQHLQQEGFEALIAAAMKAACERAKALGAPFNSI